MSDEIPEELRNGGEETPDACVEAIKACIQRNTTGLTITSIHPSDSIASLTGNHEQRYHVDVFRSINGGTREGIVHVDAYKEGREWKADHIQTNI